MKSLTQSQLLQKYKGEDNNLPSLDRALRRASGFGPVEDVSALIALGAAVNAVGGDGKTALHWAITKGKEDNKNLLLKHGASFYTLDRTSIVPLENLYQLKLGKPQYNRPIYNNSSIQIILPFLTYQDNKVLHHTCVTLAVFSLKYEMQLFNKLSIGNKEQFDKLPEIFKPLLTKQLFMNNIKEVNLILTLMKLQQNLRKAEIINELNLVFPANFSDKTLDENGIILIVLKIFSPAEMMKHPKLLNKFAVYMISEGLLTIESLSLFKHSGSIYGPHDNLNALLSSNGIKAIKKGLLTLEDAPYLQDLCGVLSDQGLKLLEDKLINSELITAICKKHYHFFMHKLTDPVIVELMNKKIIQLNLLDPKNDEDVKLAIYIYENLNLFSNPDCQSILSKKLITLKQLAKIGYISTLNIQYLVKILDKKLIPVETFITNPNLKDILSQNGVIALNEGLLTLEQVVKFKLIKNLMSDNGIKLLRNEKVTVNDLLIVESKNNLLTLVSDNGIAALNENIITIDDAKTISLAVLLIPNAIQALREKLITINQTLQFKQIESSRSLKTLFSETGLQALREGLITLDDAVYFFHSGSVHLNQDNLHILLNRVGIIALRKKLITPKEASEIVELDKLFQVDNPDIITAMEMGLILPADFKYGAKYSLWGGFHQNNMIKFTNNLINEHTEKLISSDSKNDVLEKTKSAIVLQKVWRGHYGRNRFKLFREVSDIIKSGKANIHNIHQLSSTLNSIEKGNLREAKKQISSLKH